MPENVRVRLSLGDVLLAAGRPAEAESLLARSAGGRGRTARTRRTCIKDWAWRCAASTGMKKRWRIMQSAAALNPDPASDAIRRGNPAGPEAL